ncbi:hypothetical protein GCM10009731_15740 [Streptomyces globosus]
MPPAPGGVGRTLAGHRYQRPPDRGKPLREMPVRRRAIRPLAPGPSDGARSARKDARSV